MNQSKPEYGPHNPHPLSKGKTELIWAGKYDESGNRRAVSVPGAPPPMQRIETIDAPRDRWAIVAYIRALQRSQNAQASDVPAGINPNVETVVPQIQPGEQKYMGPGAGREYHGTGPGGRGEMGSNGANEEQGMNQTGQVRP